MYLGKQNYFPEAIVQFSDRHKNSSLVSICFLNFIYKPS